MRFPSIRQVGASARRSLGRFPFVLLAGLTCAAAAILLIEGGRGGPAEHLLRTGLLGLPLFLALGLFTERRRWLGWRRLVVPLAGLVSLAGLSLLWQQWSDGVAVRLHAQLTLGLHLLVAFAPFIEDHDQQAFWEYNKTLLLRFLTAVLYSAVLFVGLAVALAAVDNLFGVDVRHETYLELWAVIAFVFNTWFFLGGVPADFDALGRDSTYPPGLKVFAQFILIPIVATYLGILSVYMLKVVVTREWPSGWIGYLVSIVAVVGILSMLLVYPARNRHDSRWVGTYVRWFFVALLPSIAMLLVAIWKRVSQYGMTEDRYFLAVLALWLAGVAIYYGLKGFERIKLIPVSLCLLAFATAFGPWGPYAVSERSQARRLEALLVANSVLVGGRIGPPEREIPFEVRREISAVLRYLIGTHGPESVANRLRPAAPPLPRQGRAPLAGDADRSLGDPNEQARRVMAEMGLEYVEQQQSEGAEGFHYASSASAARPITGFDYVVRVDRLQSDTVSIEGQPLSYAYDEQAASFRVRWGGRQEVVLPVRPLLERLRSRSKADSGALPPEALRLETADQGFRVRIDFRFITGSMTEGGPTLQGWDGEAFLAVE